MYTEQDYTDIFLKYVTTNSKYAVLLDGEWGSGKTYFINKHLIPELKKLGKRVVYISLYGITSKTEIEREICIKSLINTESDKKNKTEAQKLLEAAAHTGGSLFTGLLKVWNFDISAIHLDYSKLTNTKDLVIIFDDLERCLLEVNETLGYINSFVEQDDIKIIIVANEKEIYKINSVQNYEMKLLVSAQDNIEIDLNTTEENNPLNTEPQHVSKKKLKVDELIRRSDEIFSRRLVYNQIKEKLIGKTIYYRSDFETLLTDLLSKPLNNDINSIIPILTKYYCEQMAYYDHYNIRTVTFSIEVLTVIIDQLHIDKLQNLTISLEIYKYCIDASIRFKLGRKPVKWNGEFQINDVNIGVANSIWESRYIKGFRFVDDFVFTSFLDEEKSLIAIQKYVAEYSTLQLSDSDPFSKLKDWSVLEDLDISRYINDMIIGIKQDSYNIKHYSQMIAISLFLQHIGFSINIDTILSLMKENLERKSEQDIGIAFDTFGIYVDTAIADKYKLAIEQITNSIGETQKTTKQEKLGQLIRSGENWAITFYDYVYAKKDDFIKERAFLSLVNMDDILSAIVNSSSKDLINFRYSLQAIYSFSNISDFYKSDYESISALRHKLKSSPDIENETGLVKRQNIKYLMEQLEKIEAALR